MTTGLAPVTPLRQERPSRSQIEPAALGLLARHSAQILATARRYSETPEDAEDAYQRGVEILLTRAPSTREAELLPWLKTVVRHEAFAVRRANGRALPVENAAGHEPDSVAWTDQHAERYERLRLGAEAMAGLKPQEIRCLLLKAEGLSYDEICEATGFSYTKVNRCLTEGRRAFSRRLAGIESGAECERLAPLLSRLADGEAGADDMRRLRPHLRNCLACRATLRSYRAAPARAAALVPPVMAAVALPGAGPLARLLELFGAGSGSKTAAVAASAVLIAGGGAARLGSSGTAPVAPPAAKAAPAAVAGPLPAPAARAPRTRVARTPARRSPQRRATATRAPAAQPMAVTPPVPAGPTAPATRAANPRPARVEPGEFGP